jgi:hypothetical protein
MTSSPDTSSACSISGAALKVLATCREASARCATAFIHHLAARTSCLSTTSGHASASRRCTAATARALAAHSSERLGRAARGVAAIAHFGRAACC